MQFRPPPPPQVRGLHLPNGLLGVTVSVRWIPLVTAAYGTWVARPVRATMLHLVAMAPAGWEGEAVLGDHRLVGKSPEGSRQLGERLHLRPVPLPYGGRSYHCCASFDRRLCF